MSNRTAWTGGNLNTGLSWTAAFNGSDINSMPTTDSVLSTVTAWANGTALDQFMDISVICAITSSAVAAGANFGFWIANLEGNGTTYGDGLLTAGTQAALTPAWYPICSIPLYASTRTSLVGSATGLLIPPGSFALIMQNNSGFTLSSSGNAVYMRTYNQNLNN